MGLGLGIGLGEGILKGGLPSWSSRYSFVFNGTNQYFNADTLQASLASDTAGSWSWWVKADDATPAGNEMLVCYGDTDALSLIFVQIVNTSGVLRFNAIQSGTNKWRINTDAQALTTGTWSLITVSQTADTAAPQIFIDGVKPAQTNAVSTDNSIWFNDIAGLDNGRYGCGNYNSGGNTQFFAGRMTKPLFTSAAMTLAQHQDIYNSGSPKDEKGIADGVAYYSEEKATFGANWTLPDQIGANDMTSVQMTLASRVTDVP